LHDKYLENDCPLKTAARTSIDTNPGGMLDLVEAGISRWMLSYGGYLVSADSAKIIF